jgi:hypothetical protein
MSDFDAEAELKSIREEAKKIRKPRISKLKRYESQLLQMHHAGARPIELQRWLKKQRMTVAFSTITRWLEKNG